MTKHSIRSGRLPWGNGGFTLLELMVTLAVLAILSAAALPSFRSLIASQAIKTSSFDFMASLILARSEAIKRNANVSVTPTGGNWLNGWAVGIVSGATLKQQSAMKSNLSVTCFSGATALAATACPAITYNSSGRLSGTAASPSIQITSNATTAAYTYCITLDLSGRPTSKKGNCP